MININKINEYKNKKFIANKVGYDPESVDVFLDELINELETFVDEHKNLLTKIQELNEYKIKFEKEQEYTTSLNNFIDLLEKVVDKKSTFDVWEKRPVRK
ncbi:DivIVA domain-containing protein [Ureaplasma urealyticum]|uniref:DivIVA domain-containing protein n=1 Tax=Ureaplasma urealyticum TaxID=2130 RepID=A0ABD4SLS3_UREUR|nr:DivIVA domain-containing protein [Ureaplasma urealyticum]MCF1349072.1 DivIVA domain-containing protein [Ureaplasma urealyticum]